MSEEIKKSPLTLKVLRDQAASLKSEMERLKTEFAEANGILKYVEHSIAKYDLPEEIGNVAEAVKQEVL